MHPTQFSLFKLNYHNMCSVHLHKISSKYLKFLQNKSKFQNETVPLTKGFVNVKFTQVGPTRRYQFNSICSKTLQFLIFSLIFYFFPSLTLHFRKQNHILFLLPSKVKPQRAELALFSKNPAPTRPAGRLAIRSSSNSTLSVFKTLTIHI